MEQLRIEKSTENRTDEDKELRRRDRQLAVKMKQMAGLIERENSRKQGRKMRVL